MVAGTAVPASQLPRARSPYGPAYVVFCPAEIFASSPLWAWFSVLTLRGLGKSRGLVGGDLWSDSPGRRGWGPSGERLRFKSVSP